MKLKQENEFIYQQYYYQHYYQLATVRDAAVCQIVSLSYFGKGFFYSLIANINSIKK